jgi:hypothetical protein
MAEDFVGVFVHVNGVAVRDNDVGVVFNCRNRDDDAILVPIVRDLSYAGFLEAISNGIQVDSARVRRMRYRCPQNVLGNGNISYKSITLETDRHISLVYMYNDRFSDRNAGIELIVDVADSFANEGVSQQSDLMGGVGSQICTQQYEVGGCSSVGIDVNEPSYSERAATECFAEFEDSDEDPDGVGIETEAPFHEPVPFMHSIDLEAMRAPEFPEYMGAVPQYEAGGEFQVGMEFPDKKAADHAIRHYNMLRSLTYKVKESSRTTLRCKCVHYGNGCNWVIRVGYVSDDDAWVVKIYDGPHTCLGMDFSQDHPKLSSNMIADSVKDMVREDVTIKVKVIRATVQREFGKFCSYRKGWLAKQKAVEMVYGNWKESYAELPSWCKVLHDRGAKIEFLTLPSYDEHNVEKHNCRTFLRLAWTFKPCIKGFLHCKPLVQVDGTHLYGKYKGTLLVAVSQDGNQNVVPIAFAVVEGETAEAWGFFLSFLRRHVVKDRVVGLISDRHASIKSAVDNSNGDWFPPKAHLRFCLRHIVANFIREHKKPGLGKMLMKMGKCLDLFKILIIFTAKEMCDCCFFVGYAKTRRVFDKYYEKMRGHSEEYTKWLDDIGDRELWALAYDDGYRCGHMTTNLVECINATLKGVRHLPISALLEATHYRMVNLFTSKSVDALAHKNHGNLFSSYLDEQMQKNVNAAGSFVVQSYDPFNKVFEVKDKNKNSRYIIDMQQRFCECGDFQIEKYPCRHAVACCQHGGVNWRVYVDKVYTIDEIIKVYSTNFLPIGHRDNWPVFNGPRIEPDPTKLRDGKGRPKSTRFLNMMDLPQLRRQKKCGKCGQPGHRCNKCPN